MTLYKSRKKRTGKGIRFHLRAIILCTFVYEALNSHTKSSYQENKKERKKGTNEKARKHEAKLVSIRIGHRNPKFMKQFVRFTYEITCSAPPLKALYVLVSVLVSLFIFLCNSL